MILMSVSYNKSPMNWDNPTLRTCGNAVYIYSDLK